MSLSVYRVYSDGTLLGITSGTFFGRMFLSFFLLINCFLVFLRSHDQNRFLSETNLQVEVSLVVTLRINEHRGTGFNLGGMRCMLSNLPCLVCIYIYIKLINRREIKTVVFTLSRSKPILDRK